ncbi:unnamed protein product [Pleuronectes platessa]|uniref:Uncharacterized protein n=1 Tax=Pleuronectes platessa TaxID=8262 RepID=A0A9N7VEX5_PLEPL|nr:unnamed protein product [Pleuronectes platessa]
MFLRSFAPGAEVTENWDEFNDTWGRTMAPGQMVRGEERGGEGGGEERGERVIPVNDPRLIWTANWEEVDQEEADQEEVDQEEADQRGEVDHGSGRMPGGSRRSGRQVVDIRRNLCQSEEVGSKEQPDQEGREKTSELFVAS